MASSVTFTIGAGGVGGTGTNDGSAGGTTTVVLSGITLTANSGGGGKYNSATDSTGGTATGGTSNATGGAGKGSSGDAGGGGGGALNGVNGNANSGGAGGSGGQSADFNGLQAAITAAGYSWTSPGTGASSLNFGANNSPGGNATGFGCGGGAAGWWGGTGGNGYIGGGGGGAAGNNTGLAGGTGGVGAAVLEYVSASTTYRYVYTTSGSHALPSDVTSVKVWAIGPGGGGGGAGPSDASAGGGGAAGGIAYRDIPIAASVQDFFQIFW